MKYKVGDSVRILPRAVEETGVSQEYVGFIGVINWINQNFGYYRVKMNDGTNWLLDDTEIELVEKGKGD